jgi:uncharacterized protein (TIRG00374 family)
MRKMSFRGWLTVITLVLLALVIFFAWPEMVKAWGLIGRIDLWILALLIPVQFFSYYATGGMIFSYLRAKGDLKDVSHWRMTRIALELNFVNHVLPSGGAAGFSYLGWLLSKFGVSPGRTTMSQIIRFALTFISFVLLLIVAVVALVIDHQISRTVILVSLGLATLSIGGTILAIFLISSRARLEKFSEKLAKFVNRIVRKLTRGKKRVLVREKTLKSFFVELHDDYMAIRRERKILVKPFIWATLANMADVALLWIAFAALGYPLNPAILFIAFGLSSIGGALSATPGGAGVYEAIMIAFLASSQVPADVAIAGTLLARVTLVLGTVLFGYAFYQLTVVKYGKSPS